MKNIKLLIVSLVALFGLVAVPAFAPQYASATPQEELCKGSGGTYAANSTGGGTCTNANAGSTDLPGFIKKIINVLLFIIGAVSVLMIIIGAVRYTISGGDSSAVNGAKNTILYAVIGLIVAFMAYAIVNFVVGAF